MKFQNSTINFIIRNRRKRWNWHLLERKLGI